MKIPASEIFLPEGYTIDVKRELLVVGNPKTYAKGTDGRLFQYLGGHKDLDYVYLFFVKLFVISTKEKAPLLFEPAIALSREMVNLPSDYLDRVKSYTGPFVIHFDYWPSIRETRRRYDVLRMLQDRALRLLPWAIHYEYGLREELIRAKRRISNLLRQHKKGEQLSAEKLEALSKIRLSRNEDKSPGQRFIDRHYEELINDLVKEDILRVCQSPSCGALFQRTPELTDYNWSIKRYCSVKCKRYAQKRRSERRRKEKPESHEA